METTIIRTPRPQIFRKPGKRAPFNAADATMVEAWSAEMNELIAALQETTLDATAKDRVHSRKELRRRLSKLMKRLQGLVATVQPLQTPPVPSVPSMASDASLEKRRLVSVP